MNSVAGGGGTVRGNTAPECTARAQAPAGVLVTLVQGKKNDNGCGRGWNGSGAAAVGSSEINPMTNASLSGDKYAAPIKNKYFGRRGEGRTGFSSSRIVVLMVSLCFVGSREGLGCEFPFF